MKYKLSTPFDGAKFAARYKLKPVIIGKVPDFWIDGEGFLNIRDDIKLPDDPPIFEAPDPMKARNTLEERIAKLEQKLGGN